MQDRDAKFRKDAEQKALMDTLLPGDVYWRDRGRRLTRCFPGSHSLNPQRALNFNVWPGSKDWKETKTNKDDVKFHHTLHKLCGLQDLS
jgi:hypothetical protein